MNLKELGELLKSEREKQGYSLEDIYKSTKISPICLRSIENGDTEELPHLVYAKGFVKNYAFFLGLNGDELADVYEKNLTVQGGLDQADEELSISEEDFADDNKTRVWTIVSILATIFLLVVLTWLVYDVFFKWNKTPPPKAEKQETLQRETNKSSTNAQKKLNMLERSENAKSVPIGKIKSSNATVKEKHLGPSKGLKDESIVISKHRKTEIRGQKKTPVQSEPDLQQMEKPNRVLENGSGKKQQEKLQKPDQKSFELSAQEKPHKLIEDKHILEISAFEACWLKAQWEDTSKEVYLRPGESVSFKFSGKLKVKLGNSGGIKLKFDNENYQLDAESGQVKTLFFP